MITTPMAPVGESERIASLDVLRGFALFGILVMNMQVFALPIGDFLDPSPAINGPRAEAYMWGMTKWLFEYKFMSLFSLLFGAGFMVQLLRAQQRGAKHGPVYVRRLLVLLAFGFVHALALWYGDILFVYAIAGFLLLLMGRIPPKVMLIIGVCVIVGLGLLYLVGGAVLAMFEESQPIAAANASTEEVVTSTQSLPLGEGENLPSWLQAMNAAGMNPSDERWRAAEVKAYSEGPLWDAFGFRLMSWLFSLAGAAFSYGWHVISMFLIGAAMLRLGFFSAAGRAWQKRLAIGGMAVGLPFEALQMWLTVIGATSQTFSPTLIGSGLHEVGSMSMTLGMAGIGCLLATSGALAFVARALANVGRMALTNYIMQTVIATSLMYWWGFGWFGSVSRIEQVQIVLAIYASQLVTSAVWLRFFRMGPLEWLWRTLTYMQPPAILRSSAQAVN
jgi:uncharacterized protein